MVGRDVEQNGNIGTEVIHIVELERREFNDVVFMRLFGNLQCQRVTDVSSQTGIVARSLEDMVDQAGCRGLAIRTRDTNHLRRGVTPSKLYLANDGDAGLDSLGNHRGCFRDARTLHDFRGVEDELLRVLALFPADATLVEHLLVFILDLRHVRNKHVEAFFLCQYGSTYAALSGT